MTKNQGRKNTRKRKISRKNTKKKNKIKKSVLIASVLIVVVVSALFVMSRQESEPVSNVTGIYQWPQNGITAEKPEIDVQLLTVNQYSRPGIEISKINGIVVHYTANPGATAQENRDYFENLKNSHQTKASSNFIVGLDGEVIQCVPTWEKAYASNERNSDTISIECCHPDESGVFTEDTYWSLVQLCAFLCDKYDLDQDDIIRHYDVTGKICPKFFVDNEDAWQEFKSNVKRALQE